MLTQEQLTKRLKDSGVLIFGDYDKENFTCHRCYGRINPAGLKQRIDSGLIRRVLIKSKIRTLHKKCFKLYVEENPNWFKEN